MKRRSFIQTASTVSLPILFNGVNLAAITKSRLFNMLDQDSDRVLVLVNLIGGNDGLNTIVPMDKYDDLANLRPQVIIPKNKLIKLTDENYFHASFSEMRNLYDNDKLAIVQNVGYPNQNRSHFRSTDIWTTASHSDEFLTTGWLGRFFESRYPSYSKDFPNEEEPDPIALTMGYIVSETCQGNAANFSVAVNNPEDMAPIQEADQTEVPNDYYGSELLFLRNAIRQTNAYTDTIVSAAEKGTNMSRAYNEESELAMQLKTVAQLISGGLRTKIYVVSIGGFDTHAGQVVNGVPHQGLHADLLAEVSQAVGAFQEDMDNQGLSHRVMGMTFSEFGRMIRSNAGDGTDHGTAAPMFLFGKCVNAGIIGTNPEIPDEVGPQDGVAMQYDFRSIYGSILIDWFGATQDEVKSILFDDFNYIPLMTGCNSTGVEIKDIWDATQAKIYPNPCMDHTRLSFDLQSPTTVKISLFDALGSELRVISNRVLSSGHHDLLIEMGMYKAGNYFLRMQMEQGQETRVFQKVR